MCKNTSEQAAHRPLHPAFHATFEPKRSVRTKRWSCIRNFAAPQGTVMPNCDAGLSKTHRMEAGMKERITPAEELYDLVFDPQERLQPP